jgi:chemotaxis protein methyltransferase CheR
VDAEAESGVSDNGTSRELESLVDAILARYHHDFRGYSRVSLRRRLASALSQMGYASLASLRDGVLREPAEFARLIDFLTVRVSELFRDPPFFRSMREHVVPILRTYPSLKVWVAGCSTGEEVWSFAILLREEGLLERTLIYATDINPRSLAAAEAGVYAQERVPLFTENHRLSGGRSSLSAHYTAAYGRVALVRSLRRYEVFSDHSLATDREYAEVHVESCGNVLIYFERALQDRALGLFSDALCRRGYLGLGARESLRFSAHRDAFEPVVREDRIYQKVAA